MVLVYSLEWAQLAVIDRLDVEVSELVIYVVKLQ